ncbi:pyruvate dehydrogenase complex transcriptional repressor PdhR [Aliidiomarina haloalkalitolerans]|uniref:Pyruvate dehydrogenase complex repressor n=1 Tax=Aliidiomarina haloalkalitolerans TaxID=859059 RepID=A0A432VSX5_9GAMM|nr:pyruvate dehydrogenase complex transcriptional repressor PdhR [Aliidiomarina haloalkalitolerans]MCL4408825.1 pyruvate dehydrogenase complex transcriptional repressor PdhR [Gammaproteobacteria bacterium]RUO19505.1 pyruvate dehydrogenase complex transcriptional repressor PdhR [Aliidiomarina haloalkalitolerans]
MIQRVAQTKLSDVIVAQIESMIVAGTWSAGQKLPSERDLAAQFQVSRPSLREAIQKLEVKGLVNRRQGGGTYVSGALDQHVSEPLFELLARHPESQFDLLEFRHALEGVSAFYAAMRGTDSDLEHIAQSFQHIANVAAAPLEQQAEALMQFYTSIAEASHNVVLLHLVRGMRDLLKENMRRNLAVLSERSDVREQLQVHRQAIVDAIIAREPEAARDACHQHLAYIEKTLLHLNREHTRLQRALRRSEPLSTPMEK